MQCYLLGIPIALHDRRISVIEKSSNQPYNPLVHSHRISMKFQLCLKFLVLLSSLIKGEVVNYTMETYGSIIVGVRDYYATSTVFLVHRSDQYEDYRGLRVTHVIHTVMRILGRYNIVSLNFHYKRMNRIQRYYDNIVRPLIVVLLPGMEDVLEFSKSTESFRMSFPVWLLIFLRIPGADLRDFCQDPQGNPFHTAYDTEMLVLCDNDDTIREWYSVQGHNVQTLELARWDPTRGFTVLTDLSMYKRRSNLNGTTLRGVVVKESPFMDLRNGELHGFFGEIFRELSGALSLSLVIVNETVEFGTYHAETKRWTGALGEIMSGRADIAISDFSMSPNRLSVLDYTVPLIMSRNAMYIMQPEIFGVQWFAYFKTFHCSVWISILTIIVIATFFLVFIWTRTGSFNVLPLICDNFLYVWGIFCQQSVTEFPEQSSLRLAYLSIFIMATVISAAYSASLICFLTACIRILPFSSIDEFVKDGSFRLVVVRESADYDMFFNTNDTQFQQIASLILPEKDLPISLEEGFQRICTNSRLALYTSDAVRRAIDSRIPCKVSSISAGRIDSLSMVLTKHNPYTNVISNHLQKFLNNGVLNRLKGTIPKLNVDREMTYKAVELFSVAPLLAIYGGGILLGTLVLIIERYYYRYKYGNDMTGSIPTNVPTIRAIERRAELQ